MTRVRRVLAPEPINPDHCLHAWSLALHARLHNGGVWAFVCRECGVTAGFSRTRREPLAHSCHYDGEDVDLAVYNRHTTRGPRPARRDT